MNGNGNGNGDKKYAFGFFDGNLLLRVVKEPQIRPITYGNGTQHEAIKVRAVCNPYRGPKHDPESIFIDVTAFDNEFAKTLKVGDQIFVHGNVSLYSYERNGVPAQGLQITVSRDNSGLVLTKRKDREGGGDEEGAPRRDRSVPPPASTNGPSGMFDDTDIPF